ncbi:hypothetical protein HNP55_003865 [Paucibacter oligotrophus]|uniref:Uncharacterized protein n=1 Tax=Roseateles oligotrophus TaxID=1769250 RepID=A0A840LGH2_9BURK|nr:hypothetical protein [Roseateles oligotrophus]
MQDLLFLRAAVERMNEPADLVAIKVGEFNLDADIEGGTRRILDQLRGAGHAEQHKGDFFELRVGGPGVVGGPEGGEEIVGKRQLDRGVYLVNEHDQLRLQPWQKAVCQEEDEALGMR